MAMVVAGAGGDNGDFLADADADVDVNAATALALDVVCEDIATDAAKGIAAFGLGAMAGPSSSSIT
jgi:hypothetical protein